MKKIFIGLILSLTFACGSDDATNNGTTSGTNNTTTTGTNNGTTTGTNNSTVAMTNNGTVKLRCTVPPGFIDYPAAGSFIVQLEGGPYVGFEESGSTPKPTSRYDGINWYIEVEEFSGRFSFEDSIGAELSPGTFPMEGLFLNFKIDTDFEDEPLNVNLSNGSVEIDAVDTTAGVIKVRLYSILSAAETKLSEDVVLNAAFDLVLPSAL